jgi:hypothetical protein
VSLLNRSHSSLLLFPSFYFTCQITSHHITSSKTSYICEYTRFIS